jgi:hypothetical protein
LKFMNSKKIITMQRSIVKTFIIFRKISEEETKLYHQNQKR